MPYPGFLAPASLKQDCPPTPHPEYPALSGVSCPGLIEAGSCGGGGGSGSGPLSGVSCPGLIEADPTCQSPSGARSAPYPGFLAPASLKHRGADPAAGTDPCLIRGFLPRPH